jgi:hypothetical protein
MYIVIMYIVLSNNSDHEVYFRQYPSILDDLGYILISSKAEQILQDGAKNSIAFLGENASRQLIDRMCSISGFSEAELLMNYDLLEKSLFKVLGKGSEVILSNLKRELLVQVVLIDPNITISEIRDPRVVVGDILKRIHTVEVVDFVRKIPSHSHVALLYTNDNSKDKLLTAFFDTMVLGNASKGLFSFKKPANDYLSGINDLMLYEELFQEPRDYEAVARRGADWIAKLISSNKSQQTTIASLTRIASEDLMWWLRNGFAGYLLDSERSRGRYLQDNFSALCGYNISNVGNQHIEREFMSSLISAHGYVILDEPSSLYRAPDLGGNVKYQSLLTSHGNGDLDP